MAKPNEERYEWREPGQRGKLIMVPKHKIRVDTRYQRTAMDRKRLAIASDFSWVAFGALVVSLRPDGEYYAIDGQQRTNAALSRSDITTIPCMVFEGLSLQEEAREFERLNRGRTNMSPIDLYRDRLVAENPIVLGVQRILNMTGHQVDNKKTAHSVGCPAVLMRCYERDPKKLEEYWPFIVRVCEGQVHEHIVKGLFYLVHSLGLDLNPYKKKLLIFGREKILRSISNTAVLMDRASGDGVCAFGVAKLLNYRRRQKIHVPLSGGE